MPAGERSGARACLVDKGQGSLPMVLVIGGLGERGRAIVSTVEAYTFSTQAAGQDLGEGGGWSGWNTHAVHARSRRSHMWNYPAQVGVPLKGTL